jgi:hypothetical protein
MNDNQRPTITIKLKPYLQEYLMFELRSNVASKRNLLGILIHKFLEYMPADVQPDFPKGPEYITFSVPFFEDINVRGNLWISPLNQQIFEQFVEWHFKQLFFHYMNDKVRLYRSFKKAILQFCADYQFTMNYLNYEMLKKDYYRKRARKKADKEVPLCVSGINPQYPVIYTLIN